MGIGFQEQLPADPLPFYQDLLLFRKLRCFFLRNDQRKHTMFKRCFDIFFCQILTDVETSLHRSGIPLLADQFALLVVFIFVKALGGTDCQISVIQFQRDFFFLEALSTRSKSLKSGRSNQLSNKFSPKILGSNILHTSSTQSHHLLSSSGTEGLDQGTFCSSGLLRSSVQVYYNTFVSTRQ